MGSWVAFPPMTIYRSLASNALVQGIKEALCLISHCPDDHASARAEVTVT
jgi:hypothetical protein